MKKLKLWMTQWLVDIVMRTYKPSAIPTASKENPSIVTPLGKNANLATRKPAAAIKAVDAGRKPLNIHSTVFEFLKRSIPLAMIIIMITEGVTRAKVANNAPDMPSTCLLYTSRCV